MPRVVLYDLVDALALQSDFLHFFLEEKTKEVVVLTKDELAQKRKESLLPLPALNEEGLIQGFCCSLEKEKQEPFYKLAQEGGGISSASLLASLHQVEGQWLVYIEETLKDIAREWCQQKGIEYEDLPREETAEWL